MENKFEQLIYKARHKMKRSRDPIHDLSHVERVVGYAKKFCEDTSLSHNQVNSLILAAWWHDTARTITKSPSLVLMPLIDDTFSALMLWKATVGCGLFGSVAGLAIRIILCKSLGTGAFFTKFLLSKKNRILVDLLSDADTVDMLYYERAVALMHLAETSRIYHFGYKILIWWCVKTAELHVKTEKARQYIVFMLKAFMVWIKEKNIFEWHIQQFGLKWVEKIVQKAEKLLEYITSPGYKSIRIGV